MARTYTSTPEPRYVEKAVEAENSTEVIANPTLSGGESDLTSIQIGETKYAVGGAVEGEDVLSTDEAAGQVLMTDGSGGAEWTADMTDDEINMLFVQKGTILTMNIDGSDKQYRVIKKVQGTIVEVISMSTAVSKQFTLNGGNTYENEVLDTYLNTTLYSSFTETAKSAIVDKVFTQDKWDASSSGNPVYSGKYGTTKPGNNNYTISLVSSEVGSELTRHVYALSVQDVLDYVLDVNITDGELQNYNIWKMFWDDEVQHTGDSNYLWTRSAQLTANAMVIRGDAGYIYNADTRYTYGVRPAFQIDLSKISYTEV